jgi:hypothetical protein
MWIVYILYLLQWWHVTENTPTKSDAVQVIILITTLFPKLLITNYKENIHKGSVFQEYECQYNSEDAFVFTSENITSEQSSDTYSTYKVSAVSCRCLNFYFSTTLNYIPE